MWRYGFDLEKGAHAEMLTDTGVIAQQQMISVFRDAMVADSIGD